jgi:hypothetical protein
MGSFCVVLQYLHDVVNGAKGLSLFVKVLCKSGHYKMLACVHCAVLWRIFQSVRHTLCFSEGKLICILLIVKIYWGSVFWHDRFLKVLLGLRCRTVPPTLHWPPSASLQSCFGFSAAFRSLISPTFLPTIHREFKKLHSSTLPVATTSSVAFNCSVCAHLIRIRYNSSAGQLYIQYEFPATIACVLRIKYYSSVCCVTESDMINDAVADDSCGSGVNGGMDRWRKLW